MSMNTHTPKKVELELVGLDGNAFVLMGSFQQAARRQGWTPEEIEVVMTQCQSGDYDNLLCVLMDNTTSPSSSPGADAFY